MLEAPLMLEGNIVLNTMLSAHWLMTEKRKIQIERCMTLGSNAISSMYRTDM